MKKDFKKLHSLQKGCKLEYKIYLGYNDKWKKRQAKISGWYCKTHDVECSKSGWEWGWWAGTNSKKISFMSYQLKPAKYKKMFNNL